MKQFTFAVKFYNPFKIVAKLHRTVFESFYALVERQFEHILIKKLYKPFRHYVHSMAYLPFKGYEVAKKALKYSGVTFRLKPLIS